MPYKDLVTRTLKQREYSKKHYEKNKKAQIARNKINRDKQRRLFNEFKATLSCIKCGQNHPATLDFHHHTPHPDNVKINVLLRNRQYSLALQEIQEKCVVLCSNCHRIHHFEEEKKG